MSTPPDQQQPKLRLAVVYATDSFPNAMLKGLSDHGIEIVGIAHSVNEARAFLEEEHPDVVLTGLMLQADESGGTRTSGVDIIREYGMHRPQVEEAAPSYPVILWSVSQTSWGVVSTALESGGSGYFDIGGATDDMAQLAAALRLAKEGRIVITRNVLEELSVGRHAAGLRDLVGRDVGPDANIHAMDPADEILGTIVSPPYRRPRQDAETADHAAPQTGLDDLRRTVVEDGATTGRLPIDDGLEPGGPAGNTLDGL